VVFHPFFELMLCWYRVRKQGSQSSTCEYTVFSVIFVEEAVFSPPYVLVSFVKNQFAVHFPYVLL
jgi:hypothetical protein